MGEQVNQSYEHQLPFYMNVDGHKQPKYSSNWERNVAYHHGGYVPETYAPTKTADDVRIAVANFSEKVHQDAPKDACKYLQIEEFRCLCTNQYETQPNVAAKKCVKWWDELQSASGTKQNSTMAPH